MFQQRFPIQEAYLVGGYGYVSVRLSVLEPVYRVQGDERYCLGSVEGSELVSTRWMTPSHMEGEIQKYGAMRFAHQYGADAASGIICFEKKAAKQLAHLHMLNTSLKLERSVLPDGYGFIRLAPQDVHTLLARWGMGLLKAAQDELVKGSAATAEEFARTALCCFSDTDISHKREAHLRVIASLLHRNEDWRLSMACLSAGWTLKLASSKGILLDAREFLESLNLLRP